MSSNGESSILRCGMSLWDQRSELGRAEPWLRAIGGGIWLFIGLSRGLSGWHDGAPLPPWIWPWLGFGAAFAISSAHRHLPRWLAVAGLALQTSSVLLLPGLGLPGLEGLLLAIVAAQVPTILSLRVSVVWACVQLIPLAAIVWTLKRPVELAEILGAYSAFSAFALLVYWLQQNERETRRALAAANVEILGARSLVVESVRQGERLRISHELHDSLGHQLTALRLQLELAGRRDDGQLSLEAMTKARAISQAAISDLRQVVKAIRAEAWPDFTAALNALAAGLPGTAVTIQESEGFSVSGEVGHSLFRCVQEAITNSLKHSDGRHIWVVLSQDDAEIDVRVRDDGRSNGTIVPGFGLRGIQARAAQLGGVAEVGRALGGGFEVRIVVPQDRS
jgi:signal transduction histidine kinase